MTCKDQGWKGHGLNHLVLLMERIRLTSWGLVVFPHCLQGFSTIPGVQKSRGRGFLVAINSLLFFCWDARNSWRMFVMNRASPCPFRFRWGSRYPWTRPPCSKPRNLGKIAWQVMWNVKDNKKAGNTQIQWINLEFFFFFGSNILTRWWFHVLLLFIFTPNLGKIFNLTSIFFRWVGSTTNHLR